MSDFIGRISVPAIVASGLTFPLVTDFGYGFTQDQPVVVHRFGDLDAKSEQRYAVGLGARKHTFKRVNLSITQRASLAAFWEGLQGPWQSFTYNVPHADQTTTATAVIWEDAPLSFEYLQHAVKTGLNFVEVPSTNPSYAVASSCTRFPSSTLTTALLSQVQVIIPLIHIRVREAAVPDIYLSDRRCIVGGQQYLPRVIGLGEQGGDVILSQDIKGSADTVRFTFGNADQVMTNLANDTDLKYAEIDLSFYHVGSGILLQPLWKGFIQTFSVDGTAVFGIQASDGIFQINQQYPTKTVSRTCWKTYNDGVNCPWATEGASSGAVIAAGGDPTSCDYYWNSANGCLVHGMTPYFGGHPAIAQSVNITDTTSGFFGFGQNTVTSTSIISDTVWGKGLPEIWCNEQGDPTKAFVVNAMIAAVLNNTGLLGPVFQVLGIIGAGPLGAFTISGAAAGSFVTNADGYTYLVAPMADGFPAVGLKIAANGVSVAHNSSVGLRQYVGNDPIASGDLAGGAFDLLNVPPLPYAAGTAFCEIDYPIAPGINVTAADSHSMTVPIALGLTGWTWNASDVRTAVPGLTDPFWIAINTYLRGLGMQNASSSAQEALFVRSSVFKGDGTGCAEIADTVVTPILGSGTELQFQFQGTVGDQKPLRDWLREILNCGLGYFIFEGGKLKLGCRVNASAVDAYTSGSMKFQSLKLTPIEAGFEHLIIDYADQAYQYQANTAEYQDKDHAAYYGRAGSPLTSRMHSLGSPTLSQNLRIAAVRTREEIGGVNAAEWRNARNASWSTTLLGLGNEAGQVVSITDPKIPGLRGTCSVDGSGNVTWVSGDPLDMSIFNRDILINNVQYAVTATSPTAVAPWTAAVTSFTCTPTVPTGTGVAFKIITGDFRIEKWALLKDFSIELSGKTVTPSMYDLEVGPQPMDVLPPTAPALFYGIPFGPAWAPYQIQAASNDALFPNEWTFDSDQEYIPMTDGSSQANLILTGKLPVDEFSPGAGPASIGTIAVNSTGGSIPGGLMLRICICAIDSNGLPSAPSMVALVPTPAGTNTNQLVLSNIVWPAITGMASFVVFASPQDDLICAQQAGALTPLGGGVTYTPGSITLNGPFLRSTWALPSPYVAKVRFKAKPGINHGIIGCNVTAVATGVITSSDLVGATIAGPATFVGRAVSVIGRQTGSTPYASYHITAFNPSTGALTVTPDPSAVVQVNDAIVIRNQADAANSAPYTNIADSGYVNSVENGGLGLTVNGLKGELIRVIKGTGRGTPPRRITANTASSISWDLPMQMDATSVWITEGNNWPFSADSALIQNASPLTAVRCTVPAANYTTQPMVISAFTVDVNGNESVDGDAPIREDWIYGEPGTNASPGVTLQVDGTLAIGSNQAPIAALNATRSPQGVVAYMKTGPTGAGATFNINVGGSLWMTLTIPAAAVSAAATSAQLVASGAITGGAHITLDITAVGTTVPGADLSIFIYL